VFDQYKATIYDRDKLRKRINKNKSIVATASRGQDDLYHIDDMTKFLEGTNDPYKALLVENIPPDDRNHRLGSSRSRYSPTLYGLNPLEVLHWPCS
jgi:hypothetical protein